MQRIFSILLIFLIATGSVPAQTPGGAGFSSGVTKINGARGDITLAGSGAVSVSRSGQTITISASGAEAPLALTGSSNAVVLSVTGFAGQTADVFQVFRQAGTKSFSIDSAGAPYANSLDAFADTALTLSGGAGSTGSGAAITVRGGAPAAAAGAAGGSVTITGRGGSSTGSGGAAGGLTLTGGNAGGDGSVPRAGGGITIQSGNAVGAQNGPNVGLVAGNAGVNPASGTATGNQGGGFQITPRAGGTLSAATNQTGGIAGGLTFTGAAGGDATGSGTNVGGVGSSVTIGSGVGGNASGGTSNTGGASGTVTISIGAGGTGSTANGTPGSFVVNVAGTQRALINSTQIRFGNAPGSFIGIGPNDLTGIRIYADAGGAGTLYFTTGAGVDTTAHMRKLGITDAVGNVLLIAAASSITNYTITFPGVAPTTANSLAFFATNGAITYQSPQTSINTLMAASGALSSGDIWYYNGTNVVRLAKGTDGQVLKLASGLPSWAADGGGSGTATIFDLDKGPASPSSIDEEFSGANSIAAWTDVNWTANTTSFNVNSTRADALYVTKATVASGSTNYASLVKEMPGAPSEWAAIARVRALKAHFSNYTGVGIIISDGNTAGAGNQVFCFLQYTGTGAKYDAWKLTNFTTYSTTLDTFAPTYLPTLIRVRKLGSTYYFGQSVDGNWHERAFTPGFTPTHVGLCIYNEGSGYTNIAAIEWFRFSSDPDLEVGTARTVLLN